MGCIKKYMFKNLDDNWTSNDFYIWTNIDKNNKVYFFFDQK